MLILAAFSMIETVAYAQAGQAESLQVAQVEFESGFLPAGSGKAVDLSRFEKGNNVVPGNYSVDVFVNQNWAGRMQLPFKEQVGLANAQPCFNKKALEQAGVAVTKLPPEIGMQLADASVCLPIAEIVSDAFATFDFGEQRLDLSMPQVALSRTARGYVSPEYWDSGVNAGILGYDFNAYRYNNKQFGGAQNTYHLGLNGGFNVDEWRFRHNGSFNWAADGTRKYQSITTYVQRDLTALKSQLVIGDAYTSGELFDSTGFRGVQIASDDRMLPDSMRGYAPTVRGVASSNAKVTIKQNGTVIYETTVAPGPFEFDDLYATGYGGDLDVSVLEADGRTHSFSVPYAAVPLSLRPGVNRFSATAGQIRDSGLSNRPVFAQGTWQRGLSNLMTGYAGITGSAGYAAAVVGGAFNTPAGAVGVGVTQSHTSIPDQGSLNGTSTSISFSKMVKETQTNFTVAAYRYSTGGYFSLNDAMRTRDAAAGGRNTATVLRQRDRAQISLSQGLGERGGQMYLTGSTVKYWNRSGTDVNYSVGYSNTYKNVNYSVSASRQRDSSGAMGTEFYATLSIPLGKEHPVTLSTNMSRASNGGRSMQATLSGAAGVSNAFSYGVSANHASGGGGAASTSSGSANAAYHTPYADVSGSVSSGSGYSQGSFGVRGAVVAHPGGVTLSQPVGETIGVVEAKEAEGARVINVSGLSLDGRGYAVVPYLTPYNLNVIELDPKGLSTDVELKATSQQIAPRAGSVVFMKFETESGRSAVIHATQPDGAPLPFGASVLDEEGNNIGTVGQASKMFVRGLQDKGHLTVSWGNGSESMCRIAYDLPVRQSRAKSENLQRIEATCRADGEAALEHAATSDRQPDTQDVAAIQDQS
ncbi:Outer membrane usher protein [Collimonas arenae]|uniref:Outer membrane usher protein n=1 Tax=Collimonas arenae TaxID=279058 RepID=A0A0A1FD93_9BURK|nr:Outer membrane usher protein [Collimonas arenae]